MSNTNRKPTASDPSAVIATPGDGDHIPLAAPCLDERAWQSVREALEANWVSTAGPFVDRFERQIEQHLGAQHAVATSSGTAALHVALLVAGIERDDEVIVPALSFIAPANAVRYVGAWPVFLDVEPDHWQLDPKAVADFLERGCESRGGALHNRATGRPVRAILPVHLLGHPADLDPIVELARRYELVVIEDAAESLGARYRDRPVGQPTDLACLSFNGNKIITAGSGGMVVTNRDDWAKRAIYLTTQAKDDPIEYVHHEVGFNYRMSNIHAAMGAAQLPRLTEHAAAKRRIAATYADKLGELAGLQFMAEAPWAHSTNWLTAVRVDEAVFGIDSRTLMRRLHTHGAGARPLWQPLHRSLAHRGAFTPGCPAAQSLAEQVLTLPSSVAIESEQLDRVCRVIREAATSAGRDAMS